MDVQILDNEVSTDFKKTIVDDWNATYQLVPPNAHRRNIAEQDTFYFITGWCRSYLSQIYVGQPSGTK